MKPFYIIVAIVVVVIILYLYFYNTHTNETYSADSPFNLIVVDENGNMSSTDIHPPALNEPHIPPSINIVYVDTSGNLGVLAYGNIGGSNRNILTVDANNNFSVLTPPTAPLIGTIGYSWSGVSSTTGRNCVFTFYVITDPNLYPVTKYEFQITSSLGYVYADNGVYPPSSTQSAPPSGKIRKDFTKNIMIPASAYNRETISFKVKVTNAIGTSPFSTSSAAFKPSTTPYPGYIWT